jgi:putative hydrolase of the HAD superfamily
MTRTAVLVDFGGVLTTSVLAAFENFGASVGAVPAVLPMHTDAADTRKQLHERVGIRSAPKETQ